VFPDQQLALPLRSAKIIDYRKHTVRKMFNNDTNSHEHTHKYIHHY